MIASAFWQVMLVPVLVLLGHLVGLGLWAALTYNRLVRRRVLVQEGWSGIDVQLKRRRNLVPSLVEAVKGYAQHEQRALQQVTELRTAAEAPQDLRSAANTENALTDQLKGLFALAEAYPDLKADRNFRQLMTQLADIEDQIQYSRRYYNGAVRDFNIRVQSFPSNLVARALRFQAAEFFQIETATDRAAPKVEMA
jgi:LemA protein